MAANGHLKTVISTFEPQKMMKWIEILFGLVLVIAAHIGAFFFGWNFKLYFLLMVVAVFIGLVVFKRYMHQRIAEQMLSMTDEEMATLMAGLDPDQQVDVAHRIKKRTLEPANAPCREPVAGSRPVVCAVRSKR